MLDFDVLFMGQFFKVRSMAEQPFIALEILHRSMKPCLLSCQHDMAIRGKSQGKGQCKLQGANCIGRQKVKDRGRNEKV